MHLSNYELPVIKMSKTNCTLLIKVQIEQATKRVEEYRIMPSRGLQELYHYRFVMFLDFYRTTLNSATNITKTQICVQVRKL